MAGEKEKKISGKNNKGNAILNKAKYSSDTDEWYTPYEEIVKELQYYEKQFEGKTVLCNCDNPYVSNFTYFFLRHFNRLGLKRLICTSYATSKIDLLQNNGQMQDVLGDDFLFSHNDGRGYVLDISDVPFGEKDETDDCTIKKLLLDRKNVRQLIGDGDFRSEECIKYLQESDICCTNPPFSLFSSLFAILTKYEKKYLLISNQNAITYKEIFPAIMKNEAWVGHCFGDMSFRVPDDTEPRDTRFWIDESKQKWRSIGNAMWLTNMDVSLQKREIILSQNYSPLAYPVYDNYNAINVSKVADIPKDYDGIMGVPITYLKYHNGKQFSIVGEANHGSDNEFDLFKPKIDGKELFKKILIKRKEQKYE